MTVHEDVEGGLSRRRVLQGGGAFAAIAAVGGLGYDVGSTRTAHKQRAAPPPTTTRAGTTGAPSSTLPTTRRFASRPELLPPHLQITTGSTALPPGLIFLTPGLGATQPGALIASDDGEPVWFRPLPAGTSAVNLRVQHYQGRPVLTWWEGVISSDGWGRGEVVIVDSTYREIARLGAGNGLAIDLHDFTLTPRGTALVTVYHPIRGDLTSVGGPTSGYLLDSGVQEIDVATGDVRLEWLAAHQTPVGETINPLGANGTQPETPFDPYHVNSVTLDADGDLLVSFRHLSSVVKLGRSKGAVRWRLGGKRSDFAVAPDAAFAWQHDAVRQPDGTLTLFDNGGSAQAAGHPSRAVTLRLDERARTASLVSARTRTEATVASSQGSFQVLPDGHSFVGWGDQVYFTGFDATGGVALDGRFVEATSSYRAFHDAWVGRPAERPVVATRPRTDGGTDVFASWNGATEVRRWDVLAGSATSSLARVASAPRSGFETTAGLAGRPQFVAVVALDQAGRELARSAPLRA
ncbi:MAG: hypothetical protein JWN46_241 [Acidimicrobiales bacterium]|nr:hypothetical protein [Acidimicrobiales bacterium]